MITPISEPTNEKMTIEDMIASVQQGDKTMQNYLLHTYQPFIAKCVSEVCKRYISRRDDEFSIGLSGFNEAILHYSSHKGCSFFAFAQLVVKRKVIDYIRSIQSTMIITSLDEKYDDEQVENTNEVIVATNFYMEQQESWQRKEEVKDFSEQLKAYKLSLMELAEISPKHRDARESAIQIARTIYNEPKLRDYVIEKKKLPIRDLLKIVKVSKKTLERNRKYILAIFIVLNEGYVYLNDYLKGTGL